MSRVTLDYMLGQPENQTWPPNADCPDRHLWRASSPMGTETEVLYWLLTLVAMLKPLCAVESGTHTGDGAYAIGTGLAMAGRGHLWTIESDADAHAFAASRMANCHAADWVTCVHGDDVAGMCRENGLRPNLYFCDSTEPVGPGRAREVESMMPFLAPRAVVVIHDMIDQWPVHCEAVRALPGLAMVELPTPRGLVLARVT